MKRNSENMSALQDQIREEIYRFSTPLLKVTYDPPGVDNVVVVGSGTFIKVGNLHGLLTAHHVACKFKSDCYLGLAISPSEDDFKIHRQSFSIIEIAKPVTKEFGPDLAFILLSDSDCEKITSGKNFYEMAAFRNEILFHPPEHDIGTWVTCGTLQKRIKLVESETKFAAIISIELFCAFGRADKEYVKEDYDYFEMTADYAYAAGIPQSFKGMSGGGLWHVPVKISKDNEMIPSRFLLSGVEFWQSERSDNKRNLRFHGRQSIYKHAWRKLQSSNAPNPA